METAADPTTAAAEAPPPPSVAHSIPMIALSLIRESSTNPRRHFDEKGMEDLVASVKESGVITPLLLRPKANGKGSLYEIVAGARRFRAAKKAHLLEVPANIRELDDDRALELQTIENLQREDVHPLDEALGYQALLKRPGYEVLSIAEKVGKSASYVYQRLKLAELIPEAQKRFLEGDITAGHAILIARLQPKDQKEVLTEGLRTFDNDGVVSVRNLAHWIEREIHLDLSGASWPLADALLVEKAGACTVCPKRTGANPLLFPEISKKDTCTDRVCFHAKAQAFIARQAAELEKESGTKPALVSAASAYSGNDQKSWPKGTLTRLDWKESKEGNCKNTVPAVVVATDYYNARDGGLTIGKAINACTNKRCKKHFPSSRSSYDSGSSYRPPAPTKAQKAAEEKRKAKLEEQTIVRQRVFNKVLEAAPKDLGAYELRLVARALFDQGDADEFCRQVGLEVKGGAWDRYRKAVEAYIDKISDRQQLGQLVLRMLLLENLDAAPGYLGREDTLLEVAKRYRVNVDAITKAVAVERKNAAAAAAAKASTKTPAPAKRAKGRAAEARA
jgi:ParB family chromosome partitioning protein